MASTGTESTRGHRARNVPPAAERPSDAAYCRPMPDLSAFGTALAIGAILLVMLWFAFGTQRNVRIGNDLLRWLQDGLPLVGRRTTVRWLGSSAVELRIGEAEAPFREATVLAVLEPRDVVLLWLWARFRGRRDFIIVRANLRSAPRFGVDAWDPRGWSGALVADAEEWAPIDWPDADVQARATVGADAETVRAAWGALEGATTAIWRLTVQPVVPHIELHVRPPGRDVSSVRLLEPIRDLARAVSSPR